jgi:hypothetical protein
MARVTSGLRGNFSGKIGNVVGSKWKSIDYVRIKPRKTKKVSNRQKEQRNRFAFAAKFMEATKRLFPESYKNFGEKMTAENCALSQLLNNAISGRSPNLYIDYSQMLMARGNMPVAKNPAVTLDPERINFSWQDNSDTGKAKPHDEVLIVAYCEDLEQMYYTIGHGTRSSEKAELFVPEFAGCKVHTWIAFIAADKKDAAPSVYTGEWNVLEI